MKTNLLKTMLLAVGMASGSVGSHAGTWSTIFAEDFNDASTYNKFWTSGNTGRYTVNQTLRSGTDYVMEAVPVNNGGNGTTVTYTGLTTSNGAVEDYQKSEDFRVSFEFNFCYNENQLPYFQLFNSAGTEIVGFYCTSNKGEASLRLGASGSSTGGSELATYTMGYKHQTPTTYNAVTFYTATKDEKKGTYMDVTWAGSTEAVTYTIDAENVVRLGKLVHNTKRYWNHFVFDNLKVELYSENEIVAAPSAQISAINGTKRTVSITAQDATHKVYYYMGDDNSNPTEYTQPFTVSESGTLSYYAQSTSGANSEIQKLTIKCEAVALVAPTIRRMGADSYKLTATQTEVDGLTAVPQIHYTVAGGSEQTVDNGATITGVDGDVKAWAVAEGYTNSTETTEAYVAPYNTVDTWSYDLNAFPSSYSITAIADAIDTETAATLNEKDMYNLKNIEKPNLYVENSTGWLLRNQNANAFKAYGSAASIAVNNVKTTDIIYLYAYMDNGGNAIASIANGEVKYSYDLREYFIVPSTDGAVTITVNRSTNLGMVKVGSTVASVSVTSAGFATYAPTVNVAVPEGVEAYAVALNGMSVTLMQLDAAAVLGAGKAYLLKAAEGDYGFAYTSASASAVEGNSLVAATDAVTADGTQYALASQSAGVGFYKVQSGVSIPKGKAYLKYTGEQTDAKDFYPLGLDDSTTAINAATAATSTNAKAFYTLQGVKTLRPAKGLYIVGGKKVVVK